jgi:hypothetical protein
MRVKVDRYFGTQYEDYTRGWTIRYSKVRQEPKCPDRIWCPASLTLFEYRDFYGRKADGAYIWLHTNPLNSNIKNEWIFTSLSLYNFVALKCRTYLYYYYYYYMLVLHIKLLGQSIKMKWIYPNWTHSFCLPSLDYANFRVPSTKLIHISLHSVLILKLSFYDLCINYKFPLYTHRYLWSKNFRNQIYNSS